MKQLKKSLFVKTPDGNVEKKNKIKKTNPSEYQQISNIELEKLLLEMDKEYGKALSELAKR